MVAEDGKFFENDLEKANQFNYYFCRVFTNESLTIPAPSNNPPVVSLDNVHFDKSKIKTHLLKLNISKSPGPDKIHPRMLHELSNYLDQPLFQIFSESFQLGKLPKLWKLAHVKPIHKKGKKHFLKL
jgi:hypothetical protein